MINKFTMSVEENIFLAKRNIIDNIYKSANLEGIAITFPETEAIYNGINVAHLNVNEILTINNLKHAWLFIFETMAYKTVDFPYICEINRIVGNCLFYKSGYIRQYEVSIGGTKWKPSIPHKADILQELAKIQNITNPTEKAISLMLYIIRWQIFNDGNKRTAILCANRILIENGAGLINIPVDLINLFKNELIKYYKTNETKSITDFIYTKCIDGFNTKALDPEEIEERKKYQEIFDKYRDEYRANMLKTLTNKE